MFYTIPAKKNYPLCNICTKNNNCYKRCNKYIEYEFEQIYTKKEPENKIYKCAIDAIYEEIEASGDCYNYDDTETMSEEEWKSELKKEYIIQYDEFYYHQALKKIFG